jgi:hypothetical protein
VNNTGFLILWKQSDFLNGLNTGNVGFSSSSAVTLTTTSYIQQTTDSGRLVIKSGGNYYISNRVFNAGNTTFSPTPATLSWFSYNPTAVINVEGASLIPATILDNGAINNVTEVGFYFEASGTANNPNALRIRTFTANMEAIPEPSVLALLGLAGPLCLRRKRK